MMNPIIKQKWVQALRSGDYQQGKNKLKTNNNQFCCLGVLCDVIKDDVGGYWDQNNNFVTPLDNSVSIDLLPMSVVTFTGLNSCNPSNQTDLNEFDSFFDIENYPLSYLNDQKNLTFNQLATIIENNF